MLTFELSGNARPCALTSSLGMRRQLKTHFATSHLGHSRVSGTAVRWVQDVFKDVAVERTGQNGLAGITLYATFGLLQLVGGCLDIATSALQVLAQDAGVSDSSYAQLAFARAGFPSSVSQSGVCEMWNALTCSPASRDRRSIARYR